MINNRYDFIMLFDVENGNPNGDPDAGNTPRIDAESGFGFITDVCLKRKIRNYVELVKEGEPGFNILIKADRSLNSKFKSAHEHEGFKSGIKSRNPNDLKIVRDYMCRNYFDVRVFGAVMSTGEPFACGTVKGPVQINFARSISQINPYDITITRQARTKDGEIEKTGPTEMGKKSIIPYALYRAEGYVSAALANKVTGLSDDDLELLWTAIVNMFEEDHSAARGKMCMRRLFVFRHDNVLGNCPSHVLFDKVKVEEKAAPPRSFGDYSVTVDADLPEGVELIEKI